MEPNRKIIKQYFLTNNIRFVKLYNNGNSLLIYYEKSGPKWKEELEMTKEEKQVWNYLKKQNKEDLTQDEVKAWTDIEISKPTKNLPSNPTNWTLIISLTIVGIILVVGLIIFWRVKKRKS